MLSEHLAPFSLPTNVDVLRHVTDAQLLGNATIVVSHDEGPSQISCIVLDAEVRLLYWKFAPFSSSLQRPYRVDLKHRGHTTVHEHRCAGPSSPNPGISSLATISVEPYRRFLTGGGDGTVRMWTLVQGPSMDATSTHLCLSPTHPLTCLAYRPLDDHVFMCHAKNICFAHVEATKAPRPTPLSASPEQIHVHPQNPQVLILEVCT